MRRLSFPAALLAAAVVLLVGSHPAQAHGTAGSGLLSGLLHPLLGLDHLLLLAAVACAAVLLSGQLLFWAGGGAVIGALIGSQGVVLPAADLLAALMVAALGLLLLLPAPGRLAGPVVAVAVASHAWLHGLEAPLGSGGPAWWAGALLAALAVLAASGAALRVMPRQTSRLAPVLFIVGGVCLAASTVLLRAAGAAA